jgi:drug/metabolite transporter (DMT)-like permease
MTDKLRAYLYLHLCVLIWGFTAILGKLITLSTLPLVWWRVFICSSTLWLVMNRTPVFKMERRLILRLFGIGMLAGIHWICFYGAIKISNASIAVAAMATTAFFTAFTVPFFLKRAIKGYELAIGGLILPGMGLLVGHIDWSMRAGFALGVLGALLAAVFSTMNKKVIDQGAPPALAMSFIELSGACAVITLMLPFVVWKYPETQLLPVGNDWIWLLILAWVCTLVPYYLTLRSMQYISAFATNLTINLEPIYGVLLAAWIFREDRTLDKGFYIGLSVILIAVFSHPFLKQRLDKEEM